MRILHLRLKNLNSFVGEWSIDFTHPDYEGNGIFAITGPTGAGKSTLLDAICLALYGKTPRLDKITKNSNEIMARQTGECFAEVVFETARGKYRCFWGQHRSYKKPGEDLQHAQREIVDATTNTVLESHLSRVDAKVEEITGMDFQRFTRSMLLAQGAFDVFLKASPSERAPILEQITGTEIYSKISVSVFERTKNEGRKLEDLQRSLEGIHLLSESEQERYTQEFQEKNAQMTAINQTLQSLHKDKALLGEINRHLEQLKTVELSWEIHLQDEALFKPLDKKLELAFKALNFEGNYRDLCHLRTRKQELDRLHATALADGVAIEKVIKEKQQAFEAREKAFALLQDEHVQESHRIKEVRGIDQDLKREYAQNAALAERIKHEENQLALLNNNLEMTLKKELKLKEELKIIQEYFSVYAKDESLLQTFTSIQENLARYQSTRLALNEKNNQHSLLSLDQHKLQQKLIKTQTSHAIAAQELEKRQKELQKIFLEDEALAEGKDFLQWDQVRQALESEQKEWAALIKSSDAMQECQVNQRRLADVIHALELKLTQVKEEEAELIKLKAQVNQENDQLVVQQVLQNSVLSLEAERLQLQEGAPCPLCGSSEHPYAHGNAPQRSPLEEKLKHLRHLQQQLQDQSTTCSERKYETESNLRHQLEKQKLEETNALHYQRQVIELAEKVGQKNLTDLKNLKEMEQVKIKELEEFTGRYQAYLLKGKEKERAQNTFNQAALAYSQANTELNLLESQQKELNLKQSYLKEQLDRFLNEVSLLEKALENYLKPLGIFTLSELDPLQLQTDLNKRLQTWKQSLESKKTVEEGIHQVLLEVTLHQTQREQNQKTLSGFLTEQSLNSKKIAMLLEQRKACYGTKDPDHEEQAFLKKLEHSKKDLDLLKEGYYKILHEKEALGNRLSELKKDMHAQELQLQVQQTQFLEGIQCAGFVDEKVFEAACLRLEDREDLAKQKRVLERKKMELLAEKENLEKRLSQLYQEPRSDASLGDLEEKISESTETLENLKERVIQLKNILQDDQNKQKGAKDLQDKMLQQEKESEVWKGLCSLIGSADGKKFRDIAQQMTLEMMIAHANRQLVKMSDRYLLKQSKSTPLELEVVDHYQAGEERSVKNLSGGEAFLVSLALALGLSQMSSSKVRVNTLFLDEGFGTLDEKALEVALDTLGELHQEGKIIGLISHVTALKERIATQIKIQPISGGRSRIEGPGCSEAKKL